MPTAHREPGKRPRDIRLDVFRGLCLLIIYVAHVRSNGWAAWIPARFGFSDATEIFVFCSGMASAIAFGSSFRTHGLMIGAARVAFRCWQVYWAHIGVLLVSAVAMIAVDRWLGAGSVNLDALELTPLVGATAAEALLGVLTLQWVPHYFDILPMYLVILLMIPVVMTLALIDKRAVAGFVLLTWLVAQFGALRLPADPWAPREWFFNPFAWQLVFFTGFAFMSGWLPSPPRDRRLVRTAVAVVLVTIPFAWSPLTDTFSTLNSAREMLGALTDKTHFGVLRYVHFLSLAYLAFIAVGENGRSLTGPVAELLRRLGQQSLAIFMSGLVLSFLASVMLDQIGRNLWSVPLVNLGGIAILIAIARTTAFFKAAPWSKPAMSKAPPEGQSKSLGAATSLAQASPT